MSGQRPRPSGPRGPSRAAAPGFLRAAPLGPLSALLALVLAAALSLAFLFGDLGALPFGRTSGGDGGGGGGGGAADHTPNPSVVYTPPPVARPDYKGTILFVKAGDIWAIDSTAVRRLTSDANDSSPSWSPDGSTIYYVQTRSKHGPAVYQGVAQNYDLEYPVIMRRPSVGGGSAAVVRNGLYSTGGGHYWFSWNLQPELSPDAETLAMVSNADAPNGGNVVLSLMPAAGGTVTTPNLPSYTALGHSDPAWNPKGTAIAFTYQARAASDPSLAAPRIALYAVSTKRYRFLTGPGYGRPSWSPDGQWIAAESVENGRGRDVVILDASSGAEVARLTNDGQSFAPVWSPDGSWIAFLHVDGISIDLELVQLGPGKPFAVIKTWRLTTDSQLDGPSGLAWWTPASDLPTEPTTPAATPTPTPAPTASPSSDLGGSPTPTP